MADALPTRLRDWSFTDLYLSSSARYMSGVPESPQPIPIPAMLDEEAQSLYAKCKERSEALNVSADEFTLEHHHQRYRVSRLEAMHDMVYVMRRLPDASPRLRELGISQRLVAPALEANAAGLILVAGGFGEGKTSTASALVSERLYQHGGVAVTLEDPPEMPLEGNHGDGVCFQTWVTKENGGFSEQLRLVARWAPTIIFLGEIRDPATATQALKAATNGRLVVATIHAKGIVSAIERLYAFASGVGGEDNGGDLANLLGSGIAGVFHQTLAKASAETYRPPKMRFLHATDEQDATVIQAHIGARKFYQLNDVVRRQHERLRHSRRPQSPPGG